MHNIGIIREFRSDDKRTPLVPNHINQIKKNFKDINILVQPSKHRCFSDQEYKDNGGIINENLNECDLILGVKEIEPDLLISSKTYMFFSHTAKLQPDNSAAAQGTPGMDKKKLLINLLQKKIKLIDYENIRDSLSSRYLGFGRFAGIVGGYNSLNLYLKTLGQNSMQRAYEINSYDKLKEEISKKNFNKAKIIVTGDGRVAKGTLELLKSTNIIQISPEEFLENDHNSSVFCNLPTHKYVANKKGGNFDLQHFIKYPNEYISIIDKYLLKTSMLISSHYWDPKSPRLFKKMDIKKYQNLKVIGDITCDINGSIPTTIKSSTIKNPYYYLDKITFEETKDENSLAIMAVDNLPSELPRDSSTEFSSGIVNEVLPYIINKDDGRIIKATITDKGNFLPRYSFINDYINN